MSGGAQPQQRVFLMDGQAVYLEGDGDITDEVLQQALSQLSASRQHTTGQADNTQVMLASDQHAGDATSTANMHTLQIQHSEDGTVSLDTAVDGDAVGHLDPAGTGGEVEDDEEEGVLAVLQDENGQQQTVRLTPDQAAALGINYSELVAAASVAASQQDDEAVDETMIMPHETDTIMNDNNNNNSNIDNTTSTGDVTLQQQQQQHNTADGAQQQTTSALASSVMLNLDDKSGIVNHTIGGDKVTYTFEVVDKDSATSTSSSAVAANSAGHDLLMKSRQLMVPQLRTDSSKTSGQHTVSHHQPIAKKPAVNTQVFKPGTVPRSAYPASDSLKSVGRTVGGGGRTKTAVTPQHFVAHKKQPVIGSSVSGVGGGGGGDNTGVGDDNADLPVIMTPMRGQILPDYIETRPGLKILVRPLEPDDSASAAAAGGDSVTTDTTPPQQQTQLTADGRPLGSSDNPIQLVQQGNTFKSLQPLTADQLRQIATVLQQSRLNIPANTKNTIYDSQTNTRIVYRVVYPEEPAGRQKTPYRARGRGRGGASGRSVGRPRVSDMVDSVDSADADWSPGLEYNRDAKKRSTTKTRTGRVSKPPKYMVKDYRHIHRLDLNAPDLDDSDGGYSEWDYDELQDEQDKQGTALSSKNSNADDEELLDGIEAKPRAKRPISQSMRDRFGCRTCGAICIGYMRLEGHFRKNPTHERPPYIPTKAATAAASAAVVKKRPAAGRVGRPPSAVKRPRVDEMPDTDTIANWGPEELFAVMLELADGNVERLFDTMATCTDLFRQHMARRLRPLHSAFATNGTDVTTITVNSSRAVLAGVVEGTYAVDADISDGVPVSDSVRDTTSTITNSTGGGGLHIASVTSVTPSEDSNVDGVAEQTANGTDVSDVLEQFVDGLVDTSQYDSFPVSTATTTSSTTAVTNNCHDQLSAVLPDKQHSLQSAVCADITAQHGDTTQQQCADAAIADSMPVLNDR